MAALPLPHWDHSTADNVLYVSFSNGGAGGEPAEARLGLQLYGADLWEEFLEKNEAAFLEKFGRPMRMDDPLLWDPDADTPTALSEERVAQIFNQVAIDAGVHAAARFATGRCGFFLTAENLTQFDPEDVEWWVSEYHLHGILADEEDRQALVGILADEVMEETGAAASESPHEAAERLVDWVWEIPQAALLRISTAFSYLNLADEGLVASPAHDAAFRQLLRTQPGRIAAEGAAWVVEAAGEVEDSGTVELRLEEIRTFMLFSAMLLTSYLKTHPAGDLRDNISGLLNEVFSLNWQLPFEM